MKKVKNILLNNLPLKLASLILAAILWFLVVAINDPMDTQTFYNIPVKLTNISLLEQEDKVYEILDGTDRVNVSVRAPRSTLNDLRASDIMAEADMNKLTDINTIVIDFYSQQKMDTIESIKGSREIVKLNVEDKGTKWVKIVYEIMGEPADGYMISDVSLDQTQIEVSGPASVVEQISHAEVEMNIADASTTQSANLDIVFYDKEQKIMSQDGLRTNDKNVRMTVGILAVKKVPISLGYVGEPKEGYMVNGVAVSEPNYIKIAGTSYGLSNINKIVIPEERIDISGRIEDLVENINIKEYIPDNVKLADIGFSGRILVTVDIEPTFEKTIRVSESDIPILNVPAGFTAVHTEGVMGYEVKIRGLESVVQKVEKEHLKGNVDVKAWMEEEGITELTAGTYSIPIEFEFTKNISGDDIFASITILDQNQSEQ